MWIAASTHPPEEDAILAIHRDVVARFPDALLLWAPRHPERFRIVVESARALGWTVSTRSRSRCPGASDDVFVIDYWAQK